MPSTSSVDWLSRLPVGSSASTIVGLRHQGARDGDPLLLAARQRVADGGRRGRRGRPVSSGLERELAPLGPLDPAVDQRQFDVGQRGDARDQVERLEHEADLRLRTLASCRSSSSLTSTPPSRYWPSSAMSRQPSRFISVDLPDPDGPMMAR